MNESLIRRYEKQSRSHFSDTNRRYYVRKSDLEAILMIRTQDTTYEKVDLEVILMIRTEDTMYEKAI